MLLNWAVQQRPLVVVSRLHHIAQHTASNSEVNKTFPGGPEQDLDSLYRGVSAGAACCGLISAVKRSLSCSFTQ
ncbi:hypothetical protein AOLI_G00045000 [Acnodon oligacanthus]